MTLTPHKAIEWLEKHFVVEGRRFSIEDREWVESDLFTPVLSWKIWHRNNIDDLSADERMRVNTFHQWTPALVESLQGTGLMLSPIMMTVANLQRGAGKTTNAAGLLLASMAHPPRKTIAFVASAGSQARTILQEKFLNPIDADKTLSKHFDLKGNKLIFKRKAGQSSYLEVVDSSRKSITGRRRDILYIDEARDVNGEVIAALLPSIKAKSYFYCPHGHGSINYKDDVAPTCRMCGEHMQPNIPRVVITSTSGMTDGGSFDWFNELVEALEKDPNPYCHLYRADDAKNPAIADVEDKFLQVFATLPSISEAMDVELNNVSRAKGEDFVTKEEMLSVFDPTIEEKDGSEVPCVAFLDTSTVGDLTSLVITEQDTELSTPDDPWSHVRVAHIKTWNPRDRKDCPTGKVELCQIMDYLKFIVPRFPNLIEMRVDTRGNKRVDWPRVLVARIRDAEIQELIPWRSAIKGLKPGANETEEKDEAWSRFAERKASGTWRCYPHKRYEKEFRGLRKHFSQDGKRWTVKDKNRRLVHVDVAESGAWCCRLAWQQQIAPAPTDAQEAESLFAKSLNAFFVPDSFDTISESDF